MYRTSFTYIQFLWLFHREAASFKCLIDQFCPTDQCSPSSSHEIWALYRYTYKYSNGWKRERGGDHWSDPPHWKDVGSALTSSKKECNNGRVGEPDKRDEAHSEDKILQNFRAVKPVWALFLKYMWEWPWSQRSDHIICLELFLRDHAVVKIEVPFRSS